MLRVQVLLGGGVIAIGFAREGKDVCAMRRAGGGSSGLSSCSAAIGGT